MGAALFIIQYSAKPGLFLAASEAAVNASVRLMYGTTFAAEVQPVSAFTDRWILSDDGYISLQDSSPELVLSVSGYEIEKGALLLVSEKLPGRKPFQQWNWSQPPVISNVSSPQYCIDCKNGQPGSPVQIQQCTGASSQSWMLTPL